MASESRGEKGERMSEQQLQAGWSAATSAAGDRISRSGSNGLLSYSQAGEAHAQGTSSGSSSSSRSEGSDYGSAYGYSYDALPAGQSSWHGYQGDSSHGSPSTTGHPYWMEGGEQVGFASGNIAGGVWEGSGSSGSSSNNMMAAHSHLEAAKKLLSSAGEAHRSSGYHSGLQGSNLDPSTSRVESQWAGAVADVALSPSIWADLGSAEAGDASGMSAGLASNYNGISSHSSSSRYQMSSGSSAAGGYDSLHAILEGRTDASNISSVSDHHDVRAHHDVSAHGDGSGTWGTGPGHPGVALDASLEDLSGPNVYVAGFGTESGSLPHAARMPVSSLAFSSSNSSSSGATGSIDISSSLSSDGGGSSGGSGSGSSGGYPDDLPGYWTDEMTGSVVEGTAGWGPGAGAVFHQLEDQEGGGNTGVIDFDRGYDAGAPKGGRASAAERRFHSSGGGGGEGWGGSEEDGYATAGGWGSGADVDVDSLDGSEASYATAQVDGGGMGEWSDEEGAVDIYSQLQWQEEQVRVKAHLGKERVQGCENKHVHEVPETNICSRRLQLVAAERTGGCCCCCLSAMQCGPLKAG